MEKVTVKKTTTNYKSIKIDFLTYDESYVRIRKSVGGKLLICFHCNKIPAMGEAIGLLFTDKGNKITCSKCSQEIEREITKINTPTTRSL